MQESGRWRRPLETHLRRILLLISFTRDPNLFFSDVASSRGEMKEFKKIRDTGEAKLHRIPWSVESSPGIEASPRPQSHLCESSSGAQAAGYHQCHSPQIPSTSTSAHRRESAMIPTPAFDVAGIKPLEIKDLIGTSQTDDPGHDDASTLGLATTSSNDDYPATPERKLLPVLHHKQKAWDLPLDVAAELLLEDDQAVESEGSIVEDVELLELMEMVIAMDIEDGGGLYNVVMDALDEKDT